MGDKYLTHVKEKKEAILSLCCGTFRDDLLKKRLCREEVDLTIEVGLAKADRIIREKR